MGLFDRVNVPELIAENDIDGLEKCLDSSDYSLQFEAAEALARMENWKGFAFLVISTRNNKSTIRAAAAEMLGVLGDPRAVRHLIRLMNDDDQEVKQCAMDALREINTSDSLDAIAGFTSGASRFSNEIKDTHSPNAAISDAIFGSVSQGDVSCGLTSSIERQRSAEKHFILAGKFYEEDRFTQALTEVNITLELIPDMAEASNLKGLILEALEEHYLAIIAYQKALRSDPLLKEAQENLSELTVELDIFNTPLQEFLEGSSSEDWDMRRDAIAALSIKTEPEALDAIIRSLDDEDLEVCSLALEALECSSSPAALIALQNYYANFDVTGEEDETGLLPSIQIEEQTEPAHNEQVLEHLETPLLQTSTEYMDEANKLVDAGDYPRAAVKCHLSLLTDQYNADVHNLLGIIHEELNEYRQAYFSYKKAISCDPAFHEARTNLIELIQENGEGSLNFHTLISDLGSGEDDLIYDAVVNLGELNNPEAQEYLYSFLTHSNRSIVLAVIEALGKLNAVEAVEDIAAAGAKLWHFTASPVNMSLDQIEKSLNICLADWSDRCMVMLSLDRLKAEKLFTRTIERELVRLHQLSESFSEVGIDAFKDAIQDTVDLAFLIRKKYLQDCEHPGQSDRFHILSDGRS